MTKIITIADGITYEAKASTHGVPAGWLTIRGVVHYMRPFIVPTMIKGHEFSGSADAIGSSADKAKGGANISTRIWLIMLAADREAAGVTEDVAATHERNEASRKANAAANAAYASRAGTLTDRQINERDYDNLHNEGASGYNPHRVGDEPTYKPRHSSNERHYPEGA